MAERVLSGGRAEPVDDAAGHVVTPERVETLEHVGVLHAGPEVGADPVCDFSHKMAVSAILWLKTLAAKIWLKNCNRVTARISMG